MPKSYLKSKSYNFSIFITVFGITIFFIPIVSKIFSSFSFQLYLRNKQEIKNQQNLLGPIQIDSDLMNSSEAWGDYPVKIIIPSVKIDVAVKPSKVLGGVWEIHEDSAGYGLGSALPGRTGNSVIFAHARAGLFLPLRKIKKNDLISVQTKDDRWYSYIVVEKKEVSPDRIEVIAPTIDKTLTLFTCSGFFDLQRLIVIAKEKE